MSSYECSCCKDSAHLSSKQILARQRAENRKTIKEHGWAVPGVIPSPTSPGFNYTIGLTEAGLPELLISGLDLRIGCGLLNLVARRHAGAELKPGDVVDDILADGLKLRVREATIGDHIQQALNYYNDPHNRHGRVRLLQLVWPDENGAYPGEFVWSLGTAQKLY